MTHLETRLLLKIRK